MQLQGLEQGQGTDTLRCGLAQVTGLTGLWPGTPCWEGCRRQVGKDLEPEGSFLSTQGQLHLTPKSPVDSHIGSRQIGAHALTGSVHVCTHMCSYSQENPTYVHLYGDQQTQNSGPLLPLAPKGGGGGGV